LDNVILLVGNANTGKTTFFNAMTNKNQKTGNWHGVTNSESFGKFKVDGTPYVLVDLPGIYSLSPLSFEEQVATNVILANPDKLCLNICEQQNVTRNLYLTLQLLEAGIQTILIVNTKNKKCFLDLEKLSKKLGIPVLEFKNKKSIKNIKRKIKEYKFQNIKKNDYFENLLKQNDFPLTQKTAKSLNTSDINKNNLNSNKLYLKLKNNQIILKIKNSKFFLKLKNKNKCKNCQNCKNCENNQIENHNLKKNIDFSKFDQDFLKIKLLERDEVFLQKYHCEKDLCGQVAKARYDFVKRVLQGQNLPKTIYGKSKLDKVLLNKVFALPLFFLILLAVFYLTFFSLGAFLGDLLTSFIGTISSAVTNYLCKIGLNGWFLDMIDGAIFGGIGSVLSFLPQVCLLFLFLSILEDSGYLSRVAFLFEDIFCKIGLSGKGVYTLLMGFGCSATSIMTARNMEDQNAKTKIALITPFFSCSAKLPIYAVIGGAFFGANNVFVIFGLYLLGVLTGLLLCAILNKTLYKSKQQSFILEFAPLQSVSVGRLAKIVWENVKQFLIRIASVIVCVNVIVWIISNFSFDFRYVPIANCASMIESIGKILAPIFTPLGFGSWGAVSALLAGIIAKEVVVSSIAIFNGVNHNESKFAQSLSDPASAVFFTPQSALSFLTFCLLYTPCVSALAVVKGELGTKYALVSFFGQILIAYFSSFFIYGFLTFNVSNLLIGFSVLILIFVSTKVFKAVKTKSEKKDLNKKIA